MTEADVGPDDPATWTVATRPLARPTAERATSTSPGASARHVKSNAIVLVRDGAVVGVGAGQMSRVDSARLAVRQGRPIAPSARPAPRTPSSRSPTRVEVCLAAGVTAFVQPGGSQRDAEVIAAAERASAAMLLTGRRHFRH